LRYALDGALFVMLLSQLTRYLYRKEVVQSSIRLSLRSLVHTFHTNTLVEKYQRRLAATRDCRDELGYAEG
jgi:hypothetical protein